MKTLAYCSGLVVLVYWLPFFYLAIVDRHDAGHGGMVLLWSLPIALIAMLVGVPHGLEALRQNRNADPRPRRLALLLFGVVVSPLAVIFFGILRNA